LDLLQGIETELAGAVGDYQKLIEKDLPAFNHTLSENNLAAITASATTPTGTEK
jgi:hypothetical protein